MAKALSKDARFLFVHLPIDMKRNLVEAAHANERTLSAEARIALRRHLAGEESIAQAVEPAARRSIRGSSQDVRAEGLR